MQAVVDNWMEEARARSMTDHEAIPRPLSEKPHLELVGDSQVELVIDGRPRSSGWKDWAIDGISRLAMLPNVSFEGYHDRVTGRFREINSSASEWRSIRRSTIRRQLREAADEC